MPDASLTPPGEDKTERIGLKGRLAHIESTLRLLGGANATGAIAAGAAFHAFEKNVDVQNAIKAAAVLFLFGILTFVVSYAFLFLTTHDIDHSLHKEGEPTWPEYLFWVPNRSAEDYKKAAYWEFVVTVFGLLATFVLFIVGLWFILSMVLRL
jgi:uncharacterized membrane protein YhaH (DUF805 family)